MFLFNRKKRRELEESRDREAELIVQDTVKRIDKAIRPMAKANQVLADEDVKDIAINLVYAIRGRK